MRRIKIVGLLTITILLGCTEKPVESEPPAAERVFLNGVIYTADSQQRVVSALAVQDGTIAYVGDDAGARRYIGDNSQVVDLAETGRAGDIAGTQVLLTLFEGQTVYAAK